MNLAIDIGNTRMKWALFDGGRMSDHGTAEASQLAEVCRSHDWQRGILCATGACDLDSLGSMAGALHILSSRSRLPIAIDYATPGTLGPDRIAAAEAAAHGTTVKQVHFHELGALDAVADICAACMLIDALQPTFTAKLPLIDNIDADTAILTGRSTDESILAGVLSATRFAVEGFAARYAKEHGDMQVILTGGDAGRLWGSGQLHIPSCSLCPWLVLDGLNEILNANEE